MRELVLLSILAIASSAADLKLISQVQPDYSNIGAFYLIEEAEVSLAVSGDGIPFAIESDMGLPDNVVRALSSWRYEKFARPNKGATVILKVPIRRPLSPYVESHLTIEEKLSKATWDAIKRGESLPASAAAAMLSNLHPNEQPDLDRTALIAFCAKHASPDGNQQRTALVLWLIEHYPQAEILGTSKAAINPAGPLADPEGARKAKTLWEAAVAQNANDYVVAQHAIDFLRISDPDAAAALLVKFPHARRQRAALGAICASKALGVDGIDVASGNAASSSGIFPSVVDAILKASNVEFVLSATHGITDMARSLAAFNQLPAGYESACEQLVTHARQLYPGTTASCDVNAREMSAVDFGKDTPPEITKRVHPEYPEKARKKWISGTQTFSLLVGEDGRPENIEMLKGVLALYEACRGAILHWEFKPAMHDGHPIDVEASVEIDMHFL